MSQKEITSLQHPFVKHLCKLRQNKELRNSSQTILIMGKKTICDLAENLPIETLVLLKGEPIPCESNEIIQTTMPILKKITGVVEPDGFAAVVSFPKKESIKGKKKLLILDRLIDPGNTGTLFRTALGLGWDGIILTPNSVDPFNDKALRSSKGSALKLPFWEMTEEEILRFSKDEKLPLYVADKSGKAIETVSFPKCLMLVLGNESFGPASSFLKIAIKISIPMASSIESFNVAVAGSLIMYHINRSV